MEVIKLRKHFDLKDIEVYARNHEYPLNLPRKGKSNFRRACEKFTIDSFCKYIFIYTVRFFVSYEISQSLTAI